MLNDLIFHFLCNIIIIKGGVRGGREGREGRMGEGVLEGGREGQRKCYLFFSHSLFSFYLSIPLPPSPSDVHSLIFPSLPFLSPLPPWGSGCRREGKGGREKVLSICLSFSITRSFLSLSLSTPLPLPFPLPRSGNSYKYFMIWNGVTLMVRGLEWKLS